VSTGAQNACLLAHVFCVHAGRTIDWSSSYTGGVLRTALYFTNSLTDCTRVYSTTVTMETCLPRGISDCSDLFEDQCHRRSRKIATANQIYVSQHSTFNSVADTSASHPVVDVDLHRVFLLVVIAVSFICQPVNAAPSLLDRMAGAIPPGPVVSAPVLPQSPAAGPGSSTSNGGTDASADPCYDRDGNARRCSPDFVNAAFGRQIVASSTCGDSSTSSGTGVVRYCATSGVSNGGRMVSVGSVISANRGPSYSHYGGSSASGSAAGGQAGCLHCDPSNPKRRFPASYLTDLNNPNNVTCWISEPVTSAPMTSSATGSATTSMHNVSLTLSLGKKFEVCDVR